MPKKPKNIRPPRPHRKPKPKSKHGWFWAGISFLSRFTGFTFLSGLSFWSGFSSWSGLSFFSRFNFWPGFSFCTMFRYCLATCSFILGFLLLAFNISTPRMRTREFYITSILGMALLVSGTVGIMMLLNVIDLRPTTSTEVKPEKTKRK